MTRAQPRAQRPPSPPGAHAPPGGDPWEARAVPAALILLAILALQGVLFIGEASQTSDEGAHLAAGYSYLVTGDFRLNPEHPPLIKQIAALPLLPLRLSFPWGPLWDTSEEWNIGRIFVHENRRPNDTILLLGRLPILGLSILLGWAMFHWGRRLFGARGALLGLSLYVLDPNVVAHSSLVTTDLGVTLFIFLAVYALWRWSEAPAPRRLLAVGVMTGGAFASKFTSFWLLPILGLLGAVLIAARSPLPQRPWTGRSPLLSGGGRTARRIVALILAALLASAVAAAVVVICYGGGGLPAYAQGLARGLAHSGSGHMAYLMGEYSETGWWYYFLFAYLVKTPIGILLIVAASIAALLLGSRRGFKDEMFLWLPVLTLIAITSLWKVNIGLRHLLPVYPFLYLSAGRLASLRPGGAGRRSLARAAPAIIAVGAAWSLFEAASIAPHYLAYFNQLVGGPKNGHLYLLDSNLDWGQASKALRRYMTAENLPVIYCSFSGNSDPWYYGVRYQYTPGSGNLTNPKTRLARVPDGLPREILAVSPMILHSVHFSDRDLYAWLKGRQPIATPGYAYLVYDITNDTDAHAYISVICLNFGLADLADFEARRTLRRDPKNALARAVLQKLREQEDKRASPDPAPRP
ncbi:MAG: glycosyltransferase family 39 protein [Acidobacteria bacterium]|nr:glycosyltransferase family 39 protein [Acidobacteriota bacterium]